MKKLSDILSAGAGSCQDFGNTWDSIDAADDFAPLPTGQYICHVESGELDKSRHGTPGYKLTFVVLEGPQGDESSAGRKLWHDLWLTPAAMSMSKRDLAKLGITEPKQMEQPLPPGIRCKVQVVLQRDDDGNERNRIKLFEVIGIDTPELDPFAPTPIADETVAGSPPSLELEGGDECHPLN